MNNQKVLAKMRAVERHRKSSDSCAAVRVSSAIIAKLQMSSEEVVSRVV